MLINVAHEVVNEFNNLDASIIYFNDVYVYSDLTPHIHIEGDTVILTKDIIAQTTITELVRL